MTKKTTQRPVSNTEATTLICPHCSKTCSEKSDLTRHVRAKHSTPTETTTKAAIPVETTSSTTATKVSF